MTTDMEWWIFVIFIAVSSVYGGELLDETYISSKDLYRAKLIHAIHTINHDPYLKQTWEDRVEAYNNPSGSDWNPPIPVFTCNTSNKPAPPTSVHDLHPGYVDVVIAVGDSITAGNGVGAEFKIGVVLENRGESWSIGGDMSLDEETITIPNILRKFNPDLKGQSVCMSQTSYELKSWMNLAEPGGDNTEMLEQAVAVIDRCRHDEKIDFDNDWKLFTLFIGGNDLCGSIDDNTLEFDDRFTPEAYRAGIEAALDRLHAELPRTFVNLVPIFDVTPLTNFTTDRLCEILHDQFCSSLYTNHSLMRPLQLEYYNQLQTLVNTSKYDTKDDFTVVIQPMFVDSTPPIDPDTGRYDQSFLSPDCFHPGLKAHQSFAYATWNTMLTPVGDKPLFWPTDEENPVYYCPETHGPYLYTAKNSMMSNRKRATLI